MAARKRSQLSMNFDSERTPKLIGVVLIFLSFYLFVAFTSYFFTWENDHDIVFRFSWDMFLGDVEVDDWLGRLGDRAAFRRAVARDGRAQIYTRDFYPAPEA